MSQHVAFYEVLKDGGITAHDSTSTLEKLFFTPPPNTATDNPPFLSFAAKITNAVDLNFHITLNGVEVSTFKHEHGNFRGVVQEILDAGSVKPGIQNRLEFKYDSGGSGTILLSDIVIWYQRNI